MPPDNDSAKSSLAAESGQRKGLATHLVFVGKQEVTNKARLSSLPRGWERTSVLKLEEGSG